MNYTPNYQLSQWEASDPVQRADFNADNAKIDAALSVASFGNCRIAVGSYVGTGEFGSAHPTALTFDFYPKVIFLDTHTFYSNATLLNGPILLHGAERFSDSNNACIITWNGKTVSWYATTSTYDSVKGSKAQYNTLNRAYHYIALGTAEE